MNLIGSSASKRAIVDLVFLGLALVCSGAIRVTISSSTPFSKGRDWQRLVAMRKYRKSDDPGLGPGDSFDSGFRGEPV